MKLIVTLGLVMAAAGLVSADLVIIGTGKGAPGGTTPLNGC